MILSIFWQNHWLNLQKPKEAFEIICWQAKNKQRLECYCFWFYLNRFHLWSAQDTLKAYKHFFFYTFRFSHSKWIYANQLHTGTVVNDAVSRRRRNSSRTMVLKTKWENSQQLCSSWNPLARTSFNTFAVRPHCTGSENQNKNQRPHIVMNIQYSSKFNYF